jgi:hypothetical protein
MGKINWQRVLLGGLISALVYNLVGAAWWVLFGRAQWEAAYEGLGHPAPPVTAQFVVSFIVLTLLVGIFAVWFYAAIRPRYGAGPKTAACAGVALWVIGYLLPTIAWVAVFLPWRVPTRILVSPSAAALVAMVLATLVGAWPYKE